MRLHDLALLISLCQPEALWLATPRFVPSLIESIWPVPKARGLKKSSGLFYGQRAV